MSIANVGVIGCGTMGSGIAALAAGSGYRVIIVTRDQSKGLDRVRSLIRKAGNKSGEPEYVERTLGRLQFVTNIAEVRPHLVVECLPENLETKRKWFQDISSILPLSTILATNTSCLNPKDVFPDEDPHPCVAMHFFNPVWAMRLVEIAYVNDLARSRSSEIRAFAESLGKEPVEVPPTPGYVVNRMLDALINRAARMLDEPGMNAPTIDRTMVLGGNHPMGPLALADLIGIDTLVLNLEALFEAYGDTEYRPARALYRLTEAGHLGRKTSQGFYTYAKKR